MRAMAFEWQQRDQAAETLGVDTETLQAWIDSGHAPSRAHNGDVEVLIEFPDEDEEGDEPADEADADLGAEAAPSANGGAGSAAHVAEAEPIDADEESEVGGDAGVGGQVGGHADGRSVELVSRRELQMAGGMVAAWQRLAETAEGDLARSRRVGIIAWSLVGLLVALGGVGLWWATAAVTDSRADARHTEQQLRESGERVQTLEEHTQTLRDELTAARAQLAELRQQAQSSAAQNDKLAEQQRLTREMAESRSEASQTMAATLRDTIDRQAQRLDRLERELSEARAASEQTPDDAPQQSPQPASPASDPPAEDDRQSSDEAP